MSDLLKQKAAEKALEYVQSGMTLGLGSGSTVAFFLEFLARDLKSGALKNIRGIPTSEVTATKARELGIPLIELGDVDGQLDLAIDGADEVDEDLNLIKGLGKALLREKLVEVNAKKLVIIVDESKLVSKLGTRGPLPVEIVKFAYDASLKWLESLGCRAEWWKESDQPVLTDNGNYLVKCWFENGIDNPLEIAKKMAGRPGIVEHGLFLRMADSVIVAAEHGIRVIDKNNIS